MTKLRTFLPVYRSERGMTQEELANRVGVRRETISRLEKGQYNPSLKLAMDIAAVFPCRWNRCFSFTTTGSPWKNKRNARMNHPGISFPKGVILPQTALPASFFPDDASIQNSLHTVKAAQQ